MITDRIARITPDGIVTADEHGRETDRDADVIVFATGFHVTDSYTYVDIKGPGGEDLVDRWNAEGIAGAPRHHRRRHAEPVLPARTEHRAGAQLGGVHDRVADPLRRAGDRRGGLVPAPRRWRPRGPPRTRSTPNCRTSSIGTVWNTGGCSSWYLDEHGVNRTLWSGMTWQYWLTTRSLQALGVPVHRRRVAQAQ